MQITLIRRIAETAREHPLREKLLVVPSYRAGGEWIDRVAEATGGVMNLRLVTPKRLLLDFAEKELLRRGIRAAAPEETLAIAGRVFAELQSETRAARTDAGYFTRLPASFPLVGTIASSLDELDAAGFSSLRGTERHFASREKFDELSRLHREYRRARSRSGCAGRAELLACALSGLRRRAGNSAAGSKLPLLLVPESVRENADAEFPAFLAAWPESLCRTLEEDAENEDGGIENKHAVFSCRTADSTANEARLALRTLFRDRIPLDTVEIITTDARTYIPALCDAAMETFNCPAEEIPFTFHAGLPAAHSRPARLLAAWLAWMNDSLPPSGLARIIRDGLLGEGWRTARGGAGAPGVTPEILAARLLELPVHGSPEEYRLALGKKRGGKNGAGNDAGNDGGEDSAQRELRKAESWLARQLPGMLPDPGSAPAVLRAADRLVRLADHTASKFDAYANAAFAGTFAAWLPHCAFPGFKPIAWLEELVETLHIMGLGPQPGAAHVSDIFSGGFSGRKHTLILGLDESRFPGGSRQDPILLDKERIRLSRALPLSARPREKREAAMRRLLARLRGTVILSRAEHDVEADREQYPSVLFTRFAEKRAEKNAETKTATLAALRLRPAQSRIARSAPRDGLVPEAGEDYRRAPWTISPTDMETLAANPAEYFYKRVLKITPPDRFAPTPGKWLEGNERGNIIHDLFQDFAKELIDNEDAVTPESFDRHRVRLLDMFDAAIRKHRRRKPVRDELAYTRERGEMLMACRNFLTSEEERNATARPVRIEEAIAVSLPLPSGATLPLKGRIDRIDRINADRPGGGGLMIWDYKTGRSDKFSASDPFQEGRNLQPLLYCLMLDRELRESGRPEPVRTFSYFFPMPRDAGKIITYGWSRLVPAGMEILARLHSFLADGNYPASPLRKDREFSDYAALLEPGQ